MVRAHKKAAVSGYLFNKAGLSPEGCVDLTQGHL